MWDDQTVLMALGVLCLVAIVFSILVRPNSRARYRRVGLGQTGQAGSVRRSNPKPQTEPSPESERPREKRA